ncbi:FeoA family protein [Sulfurimonas xiamenensis]|jgi:ferrous iron transport protein A|uniref:Ferrous iron transport protein A n=1 Tax=Sulfurimonas xiamenensis TaxID=2590021 RepID=A0AAJ4DN60_9BACT|nr:FeoA family protein [Sulfurimonas xiamenensis]QFR43867.1 ferrous iron transport protein A [Sulfurimonas xiamenensis]
MSNKTKKLSDCKKACIVKVVKLNGVSELKQRLISFGIMKNAVIEVLGYAPAKSTMEIKVGKMSIALRSKEADLIEVQKYE